MKALWAAGLGALLLIAGCGGDRASSKSGSAKRGQSVLTVQWPSRARLIPTTSNSLFVSVFRGDQMVERKLIARPPSGSTQTETTFDLPLGDFYLTVDAYPNSDGSGIVQAKGAGTMSVTEETPGSATVALESTVFSLRFSPGTLDTIYVGVGQTKTLTAVAKNRSGSIVLVSTESGTEPLVWTNGNPNLIRVVANGQTAEITGLASGTTSLGVSMKVNDAGRSVGSSAFIEAQPFSFDVVPSETSKTYGTLSSSLSPSALASERGWRFSVWNTPAAPTSTAVSLTYSGATVGPPTVTIPALGSLVSVTSPLVAVTSDTAATVTATSVYGTGTATVIVKPNPLASATGSASVTGGSDASGSVALQLYALAAETVSLSCSDPDVTVPASVTIAAPFRLGLGTNYTLSRSVGFTIKTKPVTTAKTVAIVATRGDVTKSFDLTINP